VGSVRTLRVTGAPQQTDGMGRLRRWRRSRADRKAGALVLAGLAVFVATVYVVVVLGGGLLIGRTSSPSLGLSVLATALVALAFEPVQSRLEGWASRLVNGGRLSPYDVLSRFTEAVTGSYASEEVPARMAKVLADGTGAEWAQVWLTVNDRLLLAATWPPEGGDGSEGTPPAGPESPGRRALEVRQGDELLGVLRLQEREGQPLTPVEERLFSGLAAQAGLVLHGARLRAELSQRLAELSARAEELRVSRERLVEAQDAERRRLERDIHDGAQQHLVALAVNLRLAQTLARRSPERAAQVLAEQGTAARETIQTLMSLSRGIYPRLLSEQGVAAALRSAAGTSPLPVEVTDTAVGRYAAGVEAAIYFCCLEALQNAAKHSGARHVHVHLDGSGDELVLTVDDDGTGFDPVHVAVGAGLTNMRDRIDSVGGHIELRRGPGGGTRVHASVPAAQVPQPRSADVGTG
jgi:signal transduction histidine kinase